MSRKRNHRMRPETRAMQKLGIVDSFRPGDLAALNQLHTDAAVDRVMALARTSHIRLLEGNADDADILRLGGEFNTCWIAAGAIAGGELVQVRLAAGGDVLSRACLRKAQHGVYGLAGPDRMALGEAIDAVELVMHATSPKQMADAEEQLNRALRAAKKPRAGAGPAGATQRSS